MPAKPRYAVYSLDSYNPSIASVVPAGEYDSLDRAIAHAETVTYKMAVVDQLHESRGFIYTNYESSPLAPSV